MAFGKEIGWKNWSGPDVSTLTENAMNNFYRHETAEQAKKLQTYKVLKSLVDANKVSVKTAEAKLQERIKKLTENLQKARGGEQKVSKSINLVPDLPIWLFAPLSRKMDPQELETKIFFNSVVYITLLKVLLLHDILIKFLQSWFPFLEVLDALFVIFCVSYQELVAEWVIIYVPIVRMMLLDVIAKIVTVARHTQKSAQKKEN